MKFDVIMEKGAKLRPIEIKSGETLRKDSFKGVRKWLSLAGQDAENPAVCYGGNESYDRLGITVVPWNQVEDLPG